MPRCWYLYGQDSSPHTCIGTSCQRSTLCAQHRLRLTMQHVYGHTGNLGNECAAVLGAFGFESSRNLATRWVRHNFDTSARFGSCNIIGEVLENTWTLELKLCRYLTAGISVQCAHYVSCSHVFQLFSVFCFAFSGLLLSQQAMDRLSSSASTASSIDDYSERNMWNPLSELFFEQVSGIFASNLVDIDLARMALSCHFALDLLCYKEEVFRLCTVIHWASLPLEFLCVAPLSLL